MGVIFIFSLFFAILDALFVLYFKFLAHPIECDNENLYIIRKNLVTTIPFPDIYAVRLSLLRINNGVRGNILRYLIEYKEQNGSSKEIEIAVYYKMRANFEQFKQWLKEKNPSVEIKNWATNFDWAFRLFKKKDS